MSAPDTIVWAFRPLDQLGRQVGLVECDELLAAQLIADDQVDDPRIGAHALRQLEPDDPPPVPREASRQGYSDRQMHTGDETPAPAHTPTRAPAKPKPPAKRRGRPPRKDKAPR